MEKNIDNSIDNENIDSEVKKNTDKLVGNSLDKDINDIEDVVNKKINNDSDMKVREVTSNVNVVSYKKKSTNESGTRNVKKTKNVNNGNGNATVVLIVSILLSFICKTDVTSSSAPASLRGAESDVTISWSVLPRIG